MSRIVYVNGDYVPEDKAVVSLFDRGYIFGDGVYEVLSVVNGRLVDPDRMLARLENSLAGTGIAWPMEKSGYLAVHEELIRRNSLKEGMIYSQVTRGVADRDFAFPPRALPVMSAFTKEMVIINDPRAGTGVSVAFVDDVRWKMRNIKSIALLAQVLAKQQAREKRAYEGWMVEDGYVTEGTSSSAYIVKNGVLITRPLEARGARILPGIRRAILLELAGAAGIPFEERAFSVDEALSADEAITSAATFGALPVVEIEGRPVSTGKPGPVAKRLRELYVAHVLAQTEDPGES